MSAGRAPCLLTALLLATLAPAAHAQPDGALPTTTRFFEAYDADYDGRVTPGELGQSRQVFELLDRDGDGLISPEDLGLPVAYRPRPPRRRPGTAEETPTREPATPAAPDPRLARLLRMDDDGDGAVTREEFRGPAGVFDRLDRDGNGRLDAADLEADRPEAGADSGASDEGDGPRTPRRRPGFSEEALRRFDRDGDGVVSRDEFPGSDERFALLDSNGDGQLDAHDLEAAAPPEAPEGEGPPPGEDEDEETDEADRPR